MAILMRRAAAGLSGCAETTLVNHTAKSVFRPDSPQPVGKGGIYKVGNPYQINGVWYYPKEDATYNETGIGSWYRSEEHTSELQSLMRISYAVFCLKKKTQKTKQKDTQYNNDKIT